MNQYMWIIGFALLCALGASMALNMRQEAYAEGLQRHMQNYAETYKRYQGIMPWMDSTISYDLRTFDGGSTWFAVEIKNGKMHILGEAHDVYPGLLERIQDTEESFSRLTAYVEKNGPISPDDPVGRQLLQDFGFEIKER
jgi:hypothetical protein